MQIAVIGTGNVGKALGTSFIRAGHRVTFAARDQAETRQVAADLGASAAESAAAAVGSADVVVLAIPYGTVGAVADSIKAAVAGKVVVDVTNPMKADGSGLATEGGPSAAERLAAMLPDAGVAKAFNTLLASNMANPAAHGVTLDGLFATDDEHARQVMRELITSIGFRAIDVGSLSRARELESLAWLNIKLNMTFSGSWNTAIVFLGAPAAATTQLTGAASL